jgi:hypothetical protein
MDARGSEGEKRKKRKRKKKSKSQNAESPAGQTCRAFVSANG